MTANHGTSTNTGSQQETHEDRLPAIRRLYDRWARYYDWNPALALVRPARREAVSRMGLDPGDTVVDMGTGTGANLPILRDAVGPSGRVVGVDVSPGMLRRARNRVARNGWENVSLLRADVQNPPLAGPVDGILSSFVVLMYDDADRLVERWTRHVESGAVATLYATPSDRSYAPALNALLRAYLRVFENGWDPGSAGIETPDSQDAIEAVATRGERARTALDRESDRIDRTRFLFGLVAVDVGRVE